MFRKSKKGYFYFVEIILIALIVLFILLQFIESKQSYLQAEQTENLRQVGFGVLRNLDDGGVFSAYIDNYTFTASNFTALNTYIKESMPPTTNFDIEYIIGTSCFSSLGAPKTCGLNVTAKSDVSAILYTYVKRPDPITIKLYLWRLLS